MSLVHTREILCLVGANLVFALSRLTRWHGRGEHKVRPCICVLLGMMILFGCEDDMADQPRYEPLEVSSFFPDGKASRSIPENTVARGHLRSDEHLYTGRIGGQLATTYPFPITGKWLERGRQRYDIYCAVCHGATGDGQGMIVQRGFTQPPAFYPVPDHSVRLPKLYGREQYLLTAPPGHFFDVITNGWGAMFSYNDRVKPEDRWAIAMYVKALQLSQHASIQDVPPDELPRMDAEVNSTQEPNEKSNPEVPR